MKILADFFNGVIFNGHEDICVLLPVHIVSLRPYDQLALIG